MSFGKVLAKTLGYLSILFCFFVFPSPRGLKWIFESGKPETWSQACPEHLGEMGSCGISPGGPEQVGLRGALRAHECYGMCTTALKALSS